MILQPAKMFAKWVYQIKGNNTNVNTSQNGTKQIGTNQNGTDENGTKQTAAKTCPVPLERCKFCQALLRSTYQVQILLPFFTDFHHKTGIRNT